MKKLFWIGMICLTVISYADEYLLKPVSMITVDKKNQKKTGEIQLIGVPWANFSRGFIRFDLSRISGSKIRNIEKAVLSFDIDVKNNPESLPLEIMPMIVDYNPLAVNWESPGLGEAKWANAKKTNIDMGADRSIVYSPEVKSGRCEVDMTPLVSGWVFGQTPNYGLFVKMGPTIFGMPKTPAWNVVLKNCTLKITTAGDAPAPSGLDLDKETLRIYPSAHLPPISSPYYFLVFSGESTRHPASVVNVLAARLANGRPERGILPLRWHYGPNNPANSEERIIDGYVGRSTQFIGIQVDEWQGTRRAGEDIGALEDPNRVLKEQKIDWAIKGVLEAKKKNPAFFILIYWRAEDSIMPLVEQGQPDLLVLEGQSNLNKRFPKTMGIGLPGVMKRLAYAKKIGVIEKTIPLYGFFMKEEYYHEGDILSKEQVENMIKTSRQLFPEMPGMAFYGNRDCAVPGNYASELLKYAEEVCYREFIQPAPKVTISSPGFEAKIASMKVVVKAQAEAVVEGNTIRQYRFFVDNRLMAESATPEYTIDTRLFGPGRHIITVHAVDSGYNRGAAQLPVTFETTKE